MIYKQPRQRTDSITYQGHYFIWKEVSESVKSVDNDLYMKIERELRNYHRYQFLPLTFTLEEAKVLRNL